MQAMICITMTYEALCAMARAAAAAANVVYVPHSMVEYRAGWRLLIGPHIWLMLLLLPLLLQAGMRYLPLSLFPRLWPMLTMSYKARFE
jgi:hypothetical protein